MQERCLGYLYLRPARLHWKCKGCGKGEGEEGVLSSEQTNRQQLFNAVHDLPFAIPPVPTIYCWEVLLGFKKVGQDQTLERLIVSEEKFFKHIGGDLMMMMMMMMMMALSVTYSMPNLMSDSQLGLLLDCYVSSRDAIICYHELVVGVFFLLLMVLVLL